MGIMDSLGQYLLGKIKYETTLIDKDGGVYHEGRRIYNTSRAIGAELAAQYIPEILTKTRNPQILEIGGGDGNAVAKLIERKLVRPSDITMTSLQPLPQHDEVKALGAHVYTGVLAERLPKQWKDKFSMVIMSVVLQHTDIEQAVTNAHRVLKTSGYFVGFDVRHAVRHATETAHVLGMNSLLSSSEEERWLHRASGLIPFVLQK